MTITEVARLLGCLEWDVPIVIPRLQAAANRMPVFDSVACMIEDLRDEMGPDFAMITLGDHKRMLTGIASDIRAGKVST